MKKKRNYKSSFIGTICSKLFLTILSASLLCGICQPIITENVQAATVSRKYGDVNGDGKIDMGDILLVQRHIAAEQNYSTRSKNPDWILSDNDFKAADINNNGKLDVGDLMSIQRHKAAENDSKVRAENPNWIINRSFNCSYPSNGYYVLVSALNDKKVVDVNGGSAEDFANIQLWDYNNTYAQVFLLTRKGQYFTIRNIKTGKAVDVKDASNTKGTNVQQYRYSDNNNAQLWKFESIGNGYYYIRSKLGNYLDVNNGNTSNGTNILTWEFNKSTNQKFKLMSVAKKYPMYTQANLRLRKSTSTGSDTLTIMPKGSLVYRYCVAGDWSLINYNGQHGYAASKYLGKNKPNNDSASKKVQQRLDKIMSGELSYNKNTVMRKGKKFTGYRANEQCKGYAKNVFYLCFKITPSSTQPKPNNYKLNSTSGMKQVASYASITASNAKKLFSGARPGDFVQIRRKHTGSHSAIVYSVTSAGVIFIEANLDGKNTVYKKSYTWADLASKNAGMTVYTASKYALK